MDRRTFLAGTGAVLLARPLAGEAQQAAKVYRIGLLSTYESSSAWEPFLQGLRDLGWAEGKNIVTERRFSEGRQERFRDLAAELIRLKVDVIVTSSSQATEAAKKATATIPIVFVSVADPVGAGFVASLARPGGNVTGVTNQFSDLGGKNLQLAREVLPHLRHVGIVWNPVDQGSALGFKAVNELYPSLNVKVTSAPVRSLEDFDGAFEILSRERPDFLIVHPSPVIFRNRQRVAEFALRKRLPTSTGVRGMVEDGSIMMSYGPDLPDLFRQTARYVNKILRGAKPADLPVEQPTKFELVINLKTAKALGLTIPPSLLGRADEVIQ